MLPAPGQGTAPVAAETQRTPTPKMIESHTLFKGHREILIRHGPDIYRLRLTQAGKLILTK